MQEHSRKVEETRKSIVERLATERKQSLQEHQKFVKGELSLKLKELKTSFNAQTAEEFETLRKLKQLQLQEREQLRERQKNYADKVWTDHKPKIDEEKKSERIKNMISPRQLMGKLSSHAEPRLWSANRGISTSAVPKSYFLSQVEALPEISEHLVNSDRKPVTDEEKLAIKKDQAYVRKNFHDKFDEYN